MHKFKCLLQTEVESVSDSDLRKKKRLCLYMPRNYRAKLPAIKLSATEEVGFSVMLRHLYHRGRDPVLISRALVEPRGRSDFVWKISPQRGSNHEPLSP